MFDDDEAARNALRTLHDDPAPPATTTVDQVLRRGRRRVFVQRASAVAGVVAVVAAIGVTTVLLRSGAQSGGVEVAEFPAPPTAPSPAWQVIELDETACKHGPGSDVEGTPPDALLPESRVMKAFTTAIEAVTGPVAGAATAQWEEHSQRTGGPRGYVEAEVPMGNGNGQLQLEAYVYGGPPAKMADAGLYSYGDCKPPTRHFLPDGTVLQMFQADTRSPERPKQHLQIYRPDGRGYVITAAGWSEADMVPVGGGGHVVKGGRGKLPTTDAQLAEIARKLVANLG